MEVFLFFITVIIVCLIAFSSKKKNRKGIPSFQPPIQPPQPPIQPPQNINDVTKYVYIDTETSSLEVDRGEVLQLSAVKIKDTGDGEVCTLDIFNKYIKPSDLIRIDPMAMKINGISLAKCQCPKITAFKEFLDFCEGRIVCGYNIGFDINMIEDDMNKEGINLFNHISSTHDVLTDVQNLMLPIPNNKLSTVSSYFGLDCNNFHNAVFDCLATMFIDLKINHSLRANIDFEEIIKAVSEDCEDTCNIDDNKCKDFFKNKNVCISGDFAAISRKRLEEKIIEYGGVIKSGMSRKVDIFISGYNFKQTTKEKKYEELVNKGWNNIVKYDEESLLKEIS